MKKAVGKEADFMIVVAILFGFLGVVNLSMIVNGLLLRIGNFIVPMWISGIFVLISGIIIYGSVRLTMEN